MFGLKSDSEGEKSNAIAFVVVGACQPRHVADGEIVPRVSIRCASRGRGRCARRYHGAITALALHLLFWRVLPAAPDGKRWAGMTWD